MWRFRRHKPPLLPSVRLADVSTSDRDYPILSVGQSRLGGSFAALGFTTDSEPRFVLATLVPVIDPSLKSIADIEVRIDENVVGYLRPPALDKAIALLSNERTQALEVPVMVTASPAGPDVRVHECLT